MRNCKVHENVGLFAWLMTSRRGELISSAEARYFRCNTICCDLRTCLSINFCNLSWKKSDSELTWQIMRLMINKHILSTMLLNTGHIGKHSHLFVSKFIYLFNFSNCLLVYWFIYFSVCLFIHLFYYSVYLFIFFSTILHWTRVTCVLPDITFHQPIKWREIIIKSKMENILL